MTFKKRGLIFIMALYEEKNTADMLGRLWKKTVLLSYVLNGELFIQRKHLKGRQIDRQKRQHRCCNFFFLPTSIGRLAKESNLVVGNLTGFFSYSCSLHCLVYSSNTSRKSSHPLSGIRMELRKLPLTSLMVMYRPCAFFLQEKKKFLFSIRTCRD